MAGVAIGHEPALSFSAQADEPAADRLRLNLRWLACTVLTGLAGASLMGGALFIAFDRDSEFAEVPHIASAAHAAAPGPTVGSSKSDRFIVRSENISSRQVIQETSVRNVGGKEFVKVTPYVRVTASLSTTRGEFAASVPGFDPLQIYSDAGETDEAGTVESEARQDDSLTVAYRPLTAYAARLGASDTLQIGEIEQTIRETMRFVADGVAYAPPVILPVSAPGIAAFDDDAMAAIAPYELASLSGTTNMTTIAKRTPPQQDPVSEEIGVEIRDGDTLLSILVDHGATRGEAMEIVDALKQKGDLPTLREGEEIRLSVAPTIEDPDRHRPIGVSLPIAGGETLSVAVAEPAAPARLAGTLPRLRRVSTSESSPRANVYDGIYDAGLSHEVPRELVDELIRVFAFDVDFQRTVSPGDVLEVFYAETGEEEGGGEPQLLFASLDLRGETKTFYRFRTPDDGMVDYYDETGTSAERFLMRKPVSSGVFRSGFGMRRHPILGYGRMHAGVDWSTRTGTPIMASGNGTVTYADWKSGYGRHVVLRHANGYETTYSHMSGFASGISEGDEVRQGQVIGYVGSTGLSTGPHLHYEVLVNGRHVDPMRIRLPRGRVLDDRMLAAFEKEKARIDALMNRAPVSTRMAAAEDNTSAQ